MAIASAVGVAAVSLAPTAVSAGSPNDNCYANYYCFSDNASIATGSQTTNMAPGYRALYSESSLPLYNEKYTNDAIIGGNLEAIRNRNNISGYTMCVYTGDAESYLVAQALFYGEYWKNLTNAQRDASGHFQRNNSQGNCPIYP